MNPRFQILEELTSEKPLTLSKAVDLETGQEVWLRRYEGEADSGALRIILETVIQSPHPNVERMIEAGKDEQGWFAILETLPSQTLSDLLRSGPLTVSEFDQLVLQTLEGLSVLHEKGIAHLALRPEAIQVTKAENGRLQVTLGHIGVGQLTRPPLTEEETARYRCLAPEQWEGQPTSRSTDIYALGCVFYESLSGRAAFEASSTQQMRAVHLSHNITPLNILAPQVKPWVSAWVMGLLTSDASKRHRHVKLARKHYDLGVHGLEQSPGASSSPQHMTAPQPAYGTPPYYGQMPVASYMPPVGNMTASTPLVLPHATVQPPMSPPQSQPPAPVVTAPVRRTPSKPTRTVALPSAKKGIPLMHWGLGGAVLLVLIVVVLWGGGSSKQEVAVRPPVEVALIQPPQPESVPNPSTSDEPFYPPIPDALAKATVPRHERGTPPNFSNLTVFLSAAGIVQTLNDRSSESYSPAGAGDLVYLWKDETELGGLFNMTADKKKPELLPMLNVIRLEPGAREHPVITFHESDALSGRMPSEATRGPFDPAMREQGMTVVQALRCRPLERLVTRSIRISSESNDKIFALQIKNNSTFTANLGPQNLYLPAVQGDFSGLCIVVFVWDADTGTAQLVCRNADGTRQEGEIFKNAPTQNPPARRYQIGDSSASLSTSGYKFNGDIAETLIYNRALKKDEVQRVESWLSSHCFGVK